MTAVRSDYNRLLIQLIGLAELRVIAMVEQSLDNLLLVLMSKGLHGDGQLHRRIAVDADKLVMIQANYIPLAFGYDGRYIHQFAGTVR